MKNLFLLGTVLSVLITGETATARMEAGPAVLELLLPAAPQISPAPAIRQASFQRPPSAPARQPEPGLGEPAPHVLLVVAVGLLLLRMRSSQPSEKFNN